MSDITLKSVNDRVKELEKMKASEIKNLLSKPETLSIVDKVAFTRLKKKLEYKERQQKLAMIFKKHQTKKKGVRLKLS